MTILCSAPSLLGGSDSGAVARRRQRWLTPRKLTPGRPRHDAVGARGRLSTHQREGAERFANDLDCGRRVVLSRAASTLRSVETHRRADGSSSGAQNAARTGFGADDGDAACLSFSHAVHHQSDLGRWRAKRYRVGRYGAKVAGGGWQRGGGKVRVAERQRVTGRRGGDATRRTSQWQTVSE